MSSILIAQLGTPLVGKTSHQFPLYVSQQSDEMLSKLLSDIIDLPFSLSCRLSSLPLSGDITLPPDW